MNDGSKEDTAGGSQRDPLFVSTLEKGFRVLEAFRRGQQELGLRELSLSEIARLAGLDKSSAQRLTSTLVTLGHLDRVPHSKRYRPGIRLIEFYYTYMMSSWLAEIAMPRLIAAAEVHDTTVNLAELDGTDIVYTVRIPHQKASYPTMVAGRRLPAFLTAAGVVMLAHRPQAEVIRTLDRSDLVPLTEHTSTERSEIEARISRARQNGYDVGVSQAVVNEISTAAPVVDASDRAIAAVQIPVYTPHWSVESVKESLVPLAVEAARAISGTLAGPG